MTRHLITALTYLLLTACGGSKPAAEAEERAAGPDFSADSAMAFCQAQCDFGPRVMNSEAHDRCAQWIAQRFAYYGCDVQLQQATLRGYDGTPLRATNIIATHRATTPSGSPLGPQQATVSSGSAAVPSGSPLGPQPASAARPHLLICAHYDSRPWADNDPDASNHHTPVMAANDGASGVAVMLELARLLQQADTARADVTFICFDAEDWGTPQWADSYDSADTWALGAQHWAKTNAAPFTFGILLDMVGGQGACFYQEEYSLQYAPQVVKRVWQAAATVGYSSLFPNDIGGRITDDHVPVNQVAAVPCIDIVPYYPDCDASSFGPTWHTLSDDMQHLDANTLKAVGQTLVQVLYGGV